MGCSDIWADRMGRVLLAVLFFGGAVQKIFDPLPVMEMLRGVSLPAFLVWPVAVFNLGAAVMLVLGFGLRPLGYLLAVYCLMTSYFHFIPQDPWQMSIMVKNWAIAGGLLILAGRPRAH